MYLCHGTAADFINSVIMKSKKTSTFLAATLISQERGANPFTNIPQFPCMCNGYIFTVSQGCQEA